KTSSTRIMGWFLAIVLVVSLAYAIYVGSYAQDEAYLMTRTRAWQFAFGGLLAIVIDRIYLSQTIRFVFGYLGLFAVISVGFILNGAQLCPGPWALWPVLGFAFVLLAPPHNAEAAAATGTAPRRFSTSVVGATSQNADA